jgi:hypothetical protein
MNVYFITEHEVETFRQFQAEVTTGRAALQKVFSEALTMEDPDANLDLHRGKNSAENSKYFGRYKRHFPHLKIYLKDIDYLRPK